MVLSQFGHIIMHGLGLAQPLLEIRLRTARLDIVHLPVIKPFLIRKRQYLCLLANLRTDLAGARIRPFQGPHARPADIDQGWGGIRHTYQHSRMSHVVPLCRQL